MKILDFIDTDFIALNTRHASGALSAILVFGGVGWVAGRVMDAGYILDGIHLAEKIVVSACIIYLTVAILWEIARKLMKLSKGWGNGSAPSFLVA
jgi:hypothetical protein